MWPSGRSLCRGQGQLQRPPLGTAGGRAAGPSREGEGSAQGTKEAGQGRRRTDPATSQTAPSSRPRATWSSTRFPPEQAGRAEASVALWWQTVAVTTVQCVQRPHRHQTALCVSCVTQKKAPQVSVGRRSQCRRHGHSVDTTAPAHCGPCPRPAGSRSHGPGTAPGEAPGPPGRQAVRPLCRGAPVCRPRGWDSRLRPLAQRGRARAQLNTRREHARKRRGRRRVRHSSLARTGATGAPRGDVGGFTGLHGSGLVSETPP